MEPEKKGNVESGSKRRTAKVLIASRQKLVRLDRPAIRRDTRAALALLGIPDRELSLLFVDDPEMREINRVYLRRNRPTNVISFSLSEGDFGRLNPNMLGDVVVSVEAADRESRIAGISFEDALFHLILHGILHLAGFNHEGPGGEVRARIMSAVQEAVFFEVRGGRLDVRL